MLSPNFYSIVNGRFRIIAVVLRFDNFFTVHMVTFLSEREMLRGFCCSTLGCPADRSVGEKKPRTAMDEGPSMTELSGYNSKREEFEIEYDNDAEQMLADMEFKETDSNAERELKLRVLRIYYKR